MKYEEKYRFIKGKKKSSNWLCLIFFGIIVFLLIYFPLFGNNMRYEFGILFSSIFTKIGIILIFLGVIVILSGILTFFNGSPFKGFGLLIFGVLLLTFGSYFLNPSSIGTGVAGGGKDVPEGYH